MNMFKPAEDQTVQATQQEPVKEKTIGEMTKEEYLQVFVEGYMLSQKAKAELSQQQTSQQPQYHQAPQNDNILTSTLGTVGGVAHGLLDVVEGVVRGVVDITTLGTARRNTR